VTAAVTALRSTASLPEIARRLRIGMPQLDAGGLSENWLLRHAGDLHWDAIARRMEVPSDQIRSAGGERLYPTFVAVRARYQFPLAAIGENETLHAAVEVAPCGRACAHGRVLARIGERRLSLELLTTFAVRSGPGLLRMALPAAPLAARFVAQGPPPPLAGLAKAARRGQLGRPEGDVQINSVDRGHTLGRLAVEPSPYADYNGAGLLYFPSYVTIADTAERQLVRALKLARAGSDWALVTSPVQRDVFYYANLPLGQALIAELVSLTRERGAVRTHVRLRRADGEVPMADILTRRLFVERRAW
jgi:probable biosynthetic protein (TIGR04098 family)